MAVTFLGIDYETYWNTKDKYSLKLMPGEAYVTDYRFKVHGAAVSVNFGKSDFLTHKELVHFFGGLDWSRVVTISHQAAFDGSITVWRYGHTPKVFIDTLGIANCFIRPYTGRVDLDACATYMGLPLKSGILKQTDGLTTEDILATPGMWEAFAEYACQDNDNACQIARTYYPQMPKAEKAKLDWSIRNYVRGRLRLDINQLVAAKATIQDERDRLLAEAGITDKKILTSTAKFAALLESLGVEVEYKDNVKKTAEIPAIAKDDPFVRETLAHPDPAVVSAMRARLAFSSNLEVTRAERLIKMAQATAGKMLLPHRYHAAHTGRPGGSDGVNLLNFPHKTPLRKAIMAPKGKVLLTVDASQAEARMMAWTAGCMPLLDAFSDPDRDAYCEYGTNIVYHEAITKRDPRRQVCKVELLSLQYGVGNVKLRHSLAAKGVNIEEAEAKQHVNGYRTAYPEILTNGKEFCELLKWCVQTGHTTEHKGFILHPGGIIRPSGNELRYAQLSIDNYELVYYSKRYKSWQKLYPGSMNENLMQALTNDHVGDVHVKYIEDTVSMVYDSIIRLVPEEVAEEEAVKTIAAMCEVPWWAELVTDRPLVLAAEHKISTTL